METMNESTDGNEQLLRRAARCLELMRGDDASLREEACAELKSMPVEAIMDVLLETRLKDRAQIERIVEMDRPIWISTIQPLFLLFAGGAIMFVNMALGVAVGLGGLGVVCWRNWAGIPAIRRNKFRGGVIYHLLNNSNNPRTTVIHAEIFRLPIERWPDREPFASAVERLIQLLPEISPDYPESLDPRQKILMNGALIRVSRMASVTKQQARVATAIMQYAANVGDLWAMRGVEVIAARRSAIPVEQRMIEQAKMSKEILQEMQRRIKLGETMLRPSGAPRGQDATLLRAISGPDQQQRDAELLRAHNGGS